MKKFPNLSSDTAQRVYVFVAALIATAAALILFSLMAGEAKNNDLNKDKILHSSCVVKSKEIDTTRVGKTYNVDTSCGKFITDSSLFETLNQDGTYDLTTTPGNWATKPSIVSIATSVK